MNLSQHTKESLNNLLSSKLRSLLTLLGILVGTASVVALVSSGELATEHALEQFKTLGTELLAVSVESDNQSQDNPQSKLTLSGVDQIVAASPGVLKAAPYSMDYSQISYNGKSIDGGVIGATEALADVAKITLQTGRFVSHLDNSEFFGVIGNGIASSLKDMGVINPIGKQIRVGDRFFTIIGIANNWPENMFMYADVNRSVIIPVGTSLTMSKYANIQNIIFKLQHGTDISTVQAQVQKAMNNIVSGARLFFRSPTEIIASMQKQQQTFTLMLASIGGISLIVGGIGVMNIMLVSVIERRREIGIRMAIGAKRKDIRYMFLTEAIVLSLFGGLMGVIVGISVSLAVAYFSKWTLHLYLMPPIIGFLVSALVGIFFGFYPAYKASQLDPIETLRSD